MRLNRGRLVADSWRQHVFFYYAYTFYTALLERNTFEAYRATCGLSTARGAWRPHLDPISYRYCSRACREWRAPSLARWIYGFFSGAMSTSSSEKHLARPGSPTPNVGIIAAT